MTTLREALAELDRTRAELLAAIDVRPEEPFDLAARRDGREERAVAEHGSGKAAVRAAGPQV